MTTAPRSLDARAWSRWRPARRPSGAAALAECRSRIRPSSASRRASRPSSGTASASSATSSWGCPATRWTISSSGLELRISLDPGKVQTSTLHVLPGTDLYQRADELGLRFDPEPPARDHRHAYIGFTDLRRAEARSIYLARQYAARLDGASTCRSLRACPSAPRTIRPFIVMDVVARAKELEAQGRDIVRLEIGDPDFPTPEVIVRAAEAAMDARRHRLHAVRRPAGPARGDHGAHAAAYGVAVDAETSSSRRVRRRRCCSSSARSSTPVTRSLWPTPAIPRIPNYVRSSAVFRCRSASAPRTASGFASTRSSERSRRRTRAIMVNSPANPTGGVLGPEDLDALAELAERTVLWLASDEIYHGLQFEGVHTVLEFTDRAFVLNGFSKAYAMTGWRLGYLIAPQQFVRPAEKIQQNFFLCANHFVQVAGTAALLHAQDDVARMRAVYDERRRYLVPALREIGLGVATEPLRRLLRVRRCPRWGADSLALAVRLAQRSRRRRCARGGLRPGRRGLPPVQLRDVDRAAPRGGSRLAEWSAARP